MGSAALGAPEIGIGDVAVLEGNVGNRAVSFTVALSAPHSADVSVRFATATGTAKASDFVAKSGVLTILAGQTSAKLAVSVKGDTVAEPKEKFSVRLSEPVGATIARATGKATILNDDPSTGVRLGIATASALEGNTGPRALHFTVSISAATTRNVTASYETVSGDAVAGQDFVATAGVVRIKAGKTAATVAIDVLGDQKVEGNESFTVQLSNPRRATLVRSVGTGTILADNDVVAPSDAETLANTAFTMTPRVPSNVDLFTSVFSQNGAPGLYPDGSAMEPAARPGALPDDEARAQLIAAGATNSCSGINTTAALAVYDSAAARTMIPDHDLRASFASLAGTRWAPAIAHYLDSGLFNPTRYGTLPKPLMAQVFREFANTKNSIVFNRRYEGENLRLKRSVWVHEILHDDTTVTVAEEVVLHAVTSMIHMELLCEAPHLAYVDTELTRYLNGYALQFLNSREVGASNSEIFAPTGTGVAPGSAQHHRDFWDAIVCCVDGDDGTSPVPDPLNVMLAPLGVPAATDFGQPMAESFEALNDSWLTDPQRAQIAVLLQLIAVDEIAQVSGLGQQQIIDTLGLAPYLAVVDANGT